ncbi:oligosaccharyl transferase, archaeosortase A system-associated [Halostella sp. JP-L12]|uniref:oligosaccharyl transferase, archaeosortase A system-associated n=1 Tax=Halostella TaxID=1843185 RepID=UPI000EF7C479|nr:MULTISPECIES: oligosaccharyl transferase, archaeosortase A system-associated [Halostella]NHN48724.1 oligosaccharyl transferase, archaeosortase A system-associated [Halostella sp. JP-L12]
MSSETETVEDESTSESSVLDIWEDWYHVPVLSVLIAFMFWVRIQARDNFTRTGEVLFRGNDAYYHLREVQYTVANWPWTMSFDPWTYFPYGNSSGGQFGSLFDQIVATAALVVGLGDPSAETVRLTLLYAPAVFGTLMAIPIYYLGKHYAGRIGGVFGVFVLALLPGTVLSRSTVGFGDHHIAEAFFVSIAILAVVKALRVAQREKPVYELVEDRDWAALREPGLYSVLAGVAIALYLWTWPPGIIFVGILGVFFTVALTLDYVRGRSPDHAAFVGVVSLLTTLPLLVFKTGSLGFETTTISLIQYFIVFAVAAGTAFMAWLAREWDDREIDRLLYPVAIGGILVVGTGLFAVVLPDAFSLIQRNVTRVLAFGQSDTARTVGEVQSVPLDSVGNFMTGQYGLTYLTAVFALFWLASQVAFSGRSYRSENLFLVVLTVFFTLMALTQRRFNYYLAISVVVLNAWLFGQAIRLIDFPTTVDRLSDVEGYQVLTLFAILLLVTVPLAPPLAPTTAVAAGNSTGPGDSVYWSQSGDWMQNNTPAPGTYANPDGEPMEYNDGFEQTEDYDYPEGAYGVMSWWDYGHWITVEGERIPNANPFQQGPRPASEFLQTNSEQRAELVLEALPSLDERDEHISNLSNDELRQIIENQNEVEQREDTRYVMIDDQMASDKFGPITRWAGPDRSEYYSTQEQTVTYPNQGVQQQANVLSMNERFENTMLARLYYHDAQGLSHYRLVHETRDNSVILSIAQRGQSTTQATGIINRRYTTRLANLLQRADLGYYDVRQESRVKTFERVEGATIEGSVDADNATNVTAFVHLNGTHDQRQFTYYQTVQTDENGDFNVTVPYATEEQLGPDDGYTNSSVRATTNYTVFTGSVDQNVQTLSARQVFQNLEQPGQTGRVDVPESAIHEGDTVTVEMESISEDMVPNASENGTDGNATDSNTTDGDTSDGNTSDGNDTDGNASDDGTNAALGARTLIA